MAQIFISNRLTALKKVTMIVLRASSKNKESARLPHGSVETLII